MFRLLWAKAKLAQDPVIDSRYCFFAKKLCFPECAENADRPCLRPYEGLAEVWDEYAHQPGYPAFLSALAHARKFELRAILDLACGTGWLTRRLVQITSEVVGLDASELMLAKARAGSAHVPGVRFVIEIFNTNLADIGGDPRRYLPYWSESQSN
jgi:SAM-dependent methyltransferase